MFEVHAACSRSAVPVKGAMPPKSRVHLCLSFPCRAPGLSLSRERGSCWEPQEKISPRLATEEMPAWGQL